MWKEVHKRCTNNNGSQRITECQTIRKSSTNISCFTCLEFERKWIKTIHVCVHHWVWGTFYI